MFCKLIDETELLEGYYKPLTAFEAHGISRGTLRLKALAENSRGEQVNVETFIDPPPFFKQGVHEYLYFDEKNKVWRIEP